MEYFQRVNPNRRHDQREVLVDLIRGERCGSSVAGDVDVVDLRDHRVEGGDVEGHGNLDADGESAYGDDESDRGAEGELNAKVQIPC